MKRLLYIIVLFSFCHNILAQTADTICFVAIGTQIWTSANLNAQSDISAHTSDSNEVYGGGSIDIQRPKFQRDVIKYLADSIKYPEYAMEKKLEGIVYITIIIEKNGSVSNITVIKSPDISLSDEAKRVVSAMPKWIPGKKNGVNIRVQELLPVRFKL